MSLLNPVFKRSEQQWVNVGVHFSSSLSIPGNVETKIPFDKIDYDLFNNAGADPSTIKINEQGIYLCICTVEITPYADGDLWILQIKGTPYRIVSETVSNTTRNQVIQAVGISTIQPVASIYATIYQTNSNSASITGVNLYTRLMVSKLN